MSGEQIGPDDDEKSVLRRAERLRSTGALGGAISRMFGNDPIVSAEEFERAVFGGQANDWAPATDWLLPDLAERHFALVPPSPPGGGDKRPSPAARGSDPGPRPAEEIRGKVDFAVLAIRDDEFTAVTERLGRLGTLETRDGQKSWQCSRISIEGEERSIAVGRLSDQGQTAAYEGVTDAILDLDPRWIVLIGIAGAVPDDDVTLGDVVLANYIHDYSLTARTEGRHEKHEHRGGPIHPEVEKIVDVVPAWRKRLSRWATRPLIGRPKPVVAVPRLGDPELYGSEEFQERVVASLKRHFPVGKVPRRPDYRVAPTSTANILVKDTWTILQWMESARMTISVEMESGGAYRASIGRNRTRVWVPVLFVRGISDIVGFKRKPEWTEYACHAAASFLMALLALPEMNVAR
jgi:nucleoside phosphorylase